MPAAAKAQQGAVPILVFHRFGPIAADSMTVTTKVFELELAWLKERHYEIIPLRQLVESMRNPGITLPSRAVVITVDDGHRTVYSEMLPIIRREQIPVTLFIYPSAISNANYAMTWEQLAELRSTGLVDIQSHSYWHPNFHHEAAKRSPAEYQDFAKMQFLRSRESIVHHLGGTVDMLAWPFGIHDKELEKWAEESGYIAAFTLDRRGARVEDDFLALPRYLMTDLDRGARFAALIADGESSR